MSLFQQQIRAPKKVLTIFLLGEQTSNLDQGMGVFVCGLQPTRIALWASISRPSSQARVTSVNSSSSLMSLETRARRRDLSSSMGQGMFSTHFVVFDQTSSLDHNNITKLWPLDGSFGQSGGRQYLFSGPKILDESETTKERCWGGGDLTVLITIIPQWLGNSTILVNRSLKDFHQHRVLLPYFNVHVYVCDSG